MSIVIIGGHDCMVCQYKKICKSFNHKAKVFTHMSADLNKQIGRAGSVCICSPTQYPTRWSNVQWMAQNAAMPELYAATPAAGQPLQRYWNRKLCRVRWHWHTRKIAGGKKDHGSDYGSLLEQHRKYRGNGKMYRRRHPGGRKRSKSGRYGQHFCR